MKAFIKTIDENAWLANLQRELDLSGDKNKDVPKIVSQDFPAVAVEVRENDQVHVGLILDMESIQGKIFRSIITTAISDFYDVHLNYTPRLVLHARDSRGQSLEALSAGKPLYYSHFH